MEDPGQSTTSIDSLPDEVLISVLANVPYSDDQYTSLQLVNKRFKNAMTSATWRREALRIHLPELSTLFGVPATVSSHDFQRLFADEHSINQVVEKLSLTNDDESQKFGLRVGVYLLHFITGKTTTQSFTREQNFALILWAQKDVLSTLAATSMRFVITRLQRKQRLRPRTLITSSDLGDADTELLTQTTHYMYLYEDICLSRALESAILLRSYSKSLIHMVASDDLNRLLADASEYGNPVRLMLAEQLWLLQDASAQFPGTDEREAHVQSQRWRLLSGGKHVQPIEGRKRCELFKEDGVLGPFLVEESTDRMTTQILKTSFDSFDQALWETVRVGMQKLMCEIKAGLIPKNLGAPASVGDMLQELMAQ